MTEAVLKQIEAKGGQIEVEPYTNAKGQRYIGVQCGAGHVWHTQMGNITGGHWCPECYGNKPLTIEMMQAVAESRGGACLSAEYVNSTTDLTWECSFGHTWEANANNVKNHGSWCPHCRVNIGEELVRTALEEAFPGKQFEKTRRLPWMGGLELDGYNEELRLAFEFQGKQHYERVQHFQRNEGDFKAQLERDKLTAQRCSDEYVTLLAISYEVGFMNIRDYVRKELDLLAYKLAPAIGSDAEFYSRVRARSPYTELQFQKVLAVIDKKGGECLSPAYLGYRIKLKIRCILGHVFEASPEAICQPESRGPRFCTVCGGTARQPDEVLREKVEACGFTFLSVRSVYRLDRTRRYLTVRCPDGHEYEVSWDNFLPTNNLPKRGCSKCHHARIGEMRRIDLNVWYAKSGLQVIGEYQANNIHCQWRCQNGHVFTATYAAIRLRKSGYCLMCPRVFKPRKPRTTRK